MITKRIVQTVLLGGTLAVPASSYAAVSLTFSDYDSTPTSRSVAAGNSFTVDVLLNQSATTDKVSGIDYRLQVSGNGSGYFRLASRTSTAVFTPAVADSSPSVAPVTFSPTNGSTDLGGDRNGNPDLSGVSTYATASYTITALANTPAGTYTFSFLNPTFSGAGPSYATTNFASLGNFTVTVPEPATAGLAAAAMVLGVRRRRV